MQRLTPSWRVVAIYFGAELPFAMLVAVAYANLISVRVDAVVGLALGLWATLFLCNISFMRRTLRPIDAWREATPDDDGPLLAARDALTDAPERATVALVLAYNLIYIALTLYLWLARSEDIPIGPAELGTIAMLVLAMNAGATTYAFPIMTRLLADERTELSRALARRGLESTTRPVSLTRRLSLLIVVFIASPGALFCAAARSSDVTLERQTALLHLDAAASAQAERIAAGLEPERGRIVETAALPSAPADSAAIDPQLFNEHRALIDRRAQIASVAIAIDDSRWLVVEAKIERDTQRLLRLLFFACVFLVGTPVVAVLVPRTLVSPLTSLQAAMRRLTRVGDLSEHEHEPVIEDDEFGKLTRDLNALIDELTALAAAAKAVSDGELHTDIDRRGDLHDAFAAMLEWLRAMVGRIRETASEVVSAATEIQAATNEQEVAARKHSRDVAEVSDRITALAAASTDITQAAAEVLVNAEFSARMSDEMTAKIGELGRQLNGITELLDIIREIADRSDLLALNGSLEATRAGDAGRGFALVAAEMRRLAERVTRTVSDVRERLEAIEQTSEETTLATEASRALAQSTAESARRISSFTSEQGENTRRVAETMEGMAEFVVAASTATGQTLAATVGLSQRIEELERLTQHFELDDSQD